MEERLSPANREQRRALFVGGSGLFSQSASTMLLSFVLASMMTSFHISGTAGGFISTITNLGMLVGGLIFGPMADRNGRVKIYAITTVIYAAATGMMAFANSITMVYFFRFLVGVGGGGVYGVIMSMVADVFNSEQRGRVTSYVTILGQVGSIVAALAAAIIIPISGWRGLFIFGALPIFLGIYVYFKMPESAEWVKVNKETSKREDDKPGLLDLFRNGNASNTIKLTIMATVQIAGYFGLMNWLPSILQKKSGLSVSSSSIWMIATIVGMSLGMLVFGQIMDRIGSKVAYSIFLFASAVSVFLYSFADTQAALLIGGTVVGFFANGMNAGYGAIVGNLYETKIRATANNLIFNIGRAIGGFSSVVIGFLLDHSSLVVTMGFLSVLYIVSLLTVLTLKGKEGRVA
ncbi:MFS transporter [Lacticaseibacillus parahuelsenbergensis]|uniref:MFS transporter n=1 Tax=Lacticaseibacillus parahuelsenbergensis TaxID=3068305 RepID=A0ABY9L1H3_9LACO|nr:MFS transporter [Lacticaseibacillus sp. NCIMB 15471]WLV77447.1 MFS transporter [Lacticaseibacillus sp. NCIMB 15471]